MQTHLQRKYAIDPQLDSSSSFRPSSIEIHFNPNVPELAQWAVHTGLPMPMSAVALGESYTRAQPWFLSFQKTLVKGYGWQYCPQDPRMLVSVSGPSPFAPPGIPYPPVLITVPWDATSFFSPARNLHFQTVFHSSGFQALRHTLPPVGNLFHLLMCLIPGLVTVVHREMMVNGQTQEITRVLPPPEWMHRHQLMLVDVFGERGFAMLYSAASTTSRAFRAISRPTETWRDQF